MEGTNMKKKFLLLAGMFVASIIGAAFNINPDKVSATVPGTNKLMSVDPSGTVAKSTSSDGGAVSNNGKFVVFTSMTNGIVSSDNNYYVDIFVRNVGANTTSRVSISTAGVQTDGNSTSPVISETGRYVVFTSTSSNLIDGVTTPTTYGQLYLRDTITNTTSLISKNSSGDLANNYMQADDISSDGRFVLLHTQASNLGPTKSNLGANLYMLDRSDGSFTILNYKYDGTLPDTNYGEFSAQMSCDGSLVAFIVSPALTTGGGPHIYLLDRRAGNKLTNLTPTFNGAVKNPTISCNGNYVGLSSYAYNVDPAFTSNSSSAYHPYVYDRINSAFSLVDKSTLGTIGSGSGDGTLSISDNGVVVFASSSDLGNVGATDIQIYVRDINSGITELLSRSSSGTPGNLSSSRPTISSNGSVASYGSNSTNLVSQSDTNSFTDVFTSLTGY
jgi:hypothetical protein